MDTLAWTLVTLAVLTVLGVGALLWTEPTDEIEGRDES